MEDGEGWSLLSRTRKMKWPTWAEEKSPVASDKYFCNSEQQRTPKVVAGLEKQCQKSNDSSVQACAEHQECSDPRCAQDKHTTAE